MQNKTLKSEKYDMAKDYPVKNPDIVARIEKKEGLLFNPADGNTMCINGTGIFVWELCDGEHSCEHIVKEITERYEVSLEKAQKDASVYLEDMEKSGFVGYKI